MPLGKKPISNELTDVQKRFCIEYLKDFNATQAAIRAGYSKKSASVQASRLLSKANIQEYISLKAKKIEERAEISIADVLKEFARIGFLDPRRLVNQDGTVKQLHEMDDDTVRAISSIEISEEIDKVGKKRKVVGYVKKIRFWDKKSALDSIGKHLGMFKDIIQHSGDPDNPIKSETTHRVIFEDMSNGSDKD